LYILKRSHLYPQTFVVNSLLPLNKMMSIERRNLINRKLANVYLNMIVDGHPNKTVTVSPHTLRDIMMTRNAAFARQMLAMAAMRDVAAMNQSADISVVGKDHSFEVKNDQSRIDFVRSHTARRVFEFEHEARSEWEGVSSQFGKDRTMGAPKISSLGGFGRPSLKKAGESKQTSKWMFLESSRVSTIPRENLLSSITRDEFSTEPVRYQQAQPNGPPASCATR